MSGVFSDLKIKDILKNTPKKLIENYVAILNTPFDLNLSYDEIFDQCMHYLAITSDQKSIMKEEQKMNVNLCHFQIQFQN